MRKDWVSLLLAIGAGSVYAIVTECTYRMDNPRIYDRAAWSATTLACLLVTVRVFFSLRGRTASSSRILGFVKAVNLIIMVAIAATAIWMLNDVILVPWPK